jgi:CheY-like chemotaxis protein/HPt (histidine-containing phosphotransfer) domain-containing protein
VAPGAKPTILLVEDEPGIRQYVAAQLRGLGYAVIEAEDGLTGRKVLEGTEGIDLLLTDVVLPNGVSGLNLARQAQALRPSLKVLLASGFSATAFEAEGGTNLPLLKKPFKRQELAEAVQRVLDAPAQATPHSSGADASRGRILVVDDLDENRRFVMTLLNKAGYAVGGAANGLEAIAAVETGDYDLVFMDAQMPELDGIEATRRIRDLPAPAGEVLIIGLSAGNLPEQIRAMEAAGMDDYVTKPFRRAELLEKIVAWGVGAGPAVDAAVPQIAEAAPKSGSIDMNPLAAGFRDVVALLGRETALLALGRLEQQIGAMFPASSSPDPQVLARQAHALVAQAGLLGFRDLADSASRLEKACLGHGDVDEAYRAAAAVAQAALATSEGLRQSGS